MKITIELSKHEQKKFEVIECVHDFKVILIKISVGSFEGLFTLDQYKSNYNGEITAVFNEVEYVKSKEQLAAENTVKKAKEALEAAEEALKIASGKI